MTTSRSTSPLGELEVRWARRDELAEVAQLTARVFDGGTPASRSHLTSTVRDIASGRHPQASPDDYAVAVDRHTGALAGAAVLFEQPWRVGGTQFVAGRPELVVTDADHRGRGVMRAVLALITTRSEERGHLTGCVTGIPHVYRRLGYDYTHRFGHGFSVPVRPGLPGRPGCSDRRTRLRPATAGDAGAVHELVEAGVPPAAVSTPMSQEYLRFGIEHQDPHSRRGLATVLAESQGRVVAVLHLSRTVAPWTTRVVGAALLAEVDPLDLLAGVMDLADRTARAGLAPSAAELVLALGDQHVLYDVARACDLPLTPVVMDSWYFTIRDRVGFARLLEGELTRRLAGSAFRHLDAVLRLDDHRSALDLHVEDGVVRAAPAGASPEGLLRLSVAPDRLASLLTAHRDVDDLRAATPETFGSPASIALARTLFPVLPAVTVPLD